MRTITACSRYMVLFSALAAILVAACLSSEAASAATVKAAPPCVPPTDPTPCGGAPVGFTGAIHAIATADTTVGPITCAAGNGPLTETSLLAKGVITNSNVTSTFGPKGSVPLSGGTPNVARIAFGRQLPIPNSATLPTTIACPATTGLGDCTATISTQIPIAIATDPASGTPTGVRYQFGPFSADLSCTGSIACSYVTGPAMMPTPATSNNVPFNANYVTFPAHLMTRTAGPVSCPSTASFSTTVALYADNGSGTPANTLKDRSRPLIVN